MPVRCSCVIAAVALGLLGAAPASAASIVFTDQAAFLAAVSNVGVDTFDDLIVGDYLDVDIFNRSAGPHTYTASVIGTRFWGLDSGGGTRWLSTGNTDDVISFDNFSPGVRGLGAFFFLTNLVGSPNFETVFVTVTDADGPTTYTLDGATPTMFLGFVSDSALTSVTVDGSGWPTVNDLHLASVPVDAAVPEPASVALLATGLLVAGVVRWRKRGV